MSFFLSLVLHPFQTTTTHCRHEQSEKQNSKRQAGGKGRGGDNSSEARTGDRLALLCACRSRYSCLISYIDSTSTIKSDSYMCSSKVHCHNCPLLPGNIECTQRVIEDPDTAVKMVCSNVQCNKSGLLHARCFDRLEKHLLKALAATSMGKKWTEAQLKANVWNCRGIHSLHKFSKCSCGGTLGRGEEEHKAFVPAVKKKEKLSQKPKLNIDGVKISYSEQKLYKQVSEEDTHVRSSRYTYLKDESRPEKHSKTEVSFGTKVDPLQVFVGDLPNDCTEDHLEELFENFGKVRYVRIYHPPTQCDYFVPSFAFVGFDSTACVQRVLAARSIMLYGNLRVKVEEKKIRVPLRREKHPPTATKATTAKHGSSNASAKSKQLPPRFLPLLKKDLTKYSKEYGKSRGYKKEDVRKILHVSTLPEDCSPNDLGELFEEYGTVSASSAVRPSL